MRAISDVFPRTRAHVDTTLSSCCFVGTETCWTAGSSSWREPSLTSTACRRRVARCVVTDAACPTSENRLCNLGFRRCGGFFLPFSVFLWCCFPAITLNASIAYEIRMVLKPSMRCPTHLPGDCDAGLRQVHVLQRLGHPLQGKQGQRVCQAARCWPCRTQLPTAHNYCVLVVSSPVAPMLGVSAALGHRNAGCGWRRCD
jgi:hypothetical protein